jgi:hypothetical protein
MTRKKKKMTHRAKPRRPRDPFWRTRRALGRRRVDGAKAYSRTAGRAALRRSLDEDA